MLWLTPLSIKTNTDLPLTSPCIFIKWDWVILQKKWISPYNDNLDQNSPPDFSPYTLMSLESSSSAKIITPKIFSGQRCLELLAPAQWKHHPLILDPCVLASVLTLEVLSMPFETCVLLVLLKISTHDTIALIPWYQKLDVLCDPCIVSSTRAIYITLVRSFGLCGQIWFRMFGWNPTKKYPRSFHVRGTCDTNNSNSWM